MSGARAWLPLIVILAGALVLRLGFGSRIVNEDALGYHGAAGNLRRGETTPLDLANVRYAFVAPIAAAQAVFGDTLGAARLVPLVYSLGSLVLVYALGILHGGLPVAVGAAALLAIVPLDVVQATDLHADLALGFWMALTVYAVMRAEVASRGRAAWFVLAGLALGAAYATKEIALILLPVLAVRLAWRRVAWRGYGWLAGAWLLTFAVDSLWLGRLTGDPLYRFSAANAGSHERFMMGWAPSYSWPLDYGRMLLDPLGTSFGYFAGLGWLGLAGAVWACVRRDRRLGELSLWWLGVTVLLSLLPLDRGFSRPLFPHVARTLHPIMIPLCLAVAVWLTCGLREARWLRCSVVTVVVALAAFGTWAIDRDNRFWNAVVDQAAPVIDRYPRETMVVTDVSSAQVLRYLLPGRDGRIRDFEHASLDASTTPTLVLRDPPFVSHAVANGRLVPAAVRVPPTTWERVGEFPRDSRPSLRGLALRLVGLTRPDSTREAEPATLWLVSPGPTSPRS